MENFQNHKVAKTSIVIKLPDDIEINFSFSFHKYVYHFQLHHSIPSSPLPLDLFLSLTNPLSFLSFLCVHDPPNLVFSSTVQQLKSYSATMLVHGLFITCFIYIFSLHDPVGLGRLKLCGFFRKTFLQTNAVNENTPSCAIFIHLKRLTKV